jgi:hypothetical protein
MKRVAILVAAVAFTLSINMKVYATGVEDLNNTQVNQTTVVTEIPQENPTDEVINEDKGVMPDSIFYLFDKAFDNLNIFFTFDDEKKIEILSQIADERLAESEVMTQEEKYDLAKSAMEQFNSLITKASEELNVLVEDNNNVILNEDKEMENTEVDLQHGEIKLENPEGDKLSELEKNILSKHLKSIEVLKKLSGKLEGNAKDAIEAVIEMQLAKKEAVANMVEKRHELNAARQEYQVVRIDLEQAKKSGDEEVIKAAQELLVEKQTAYKDSKEEFKIAFEAKKEVKNDFKKDVKKVEKKKDKANKVEENKNIQQDDKLTEEQKSEEVTEQVEVISTEEKVKKNENTGNNIEAKKAKEEHKKAEEVKKEKDKKIKEETKEKSSEKKENKNN